MAYTSSELSEVIQKNRNKYVAALLAFFLGGFGGHKFYLGQFGWGFVYMAFSWTGIPTLAGWIEGTALLIRSEQHFERNHLLKAPAHSVAHATLAAPQPSTKDLPTQLLSYARKRGGEFTLSDALIDTPYTIPEIEEALAQLAANGLARSELNLETGQMSYVFPDFKRLN